MVEKRKSVVFWALLPLTLAAVGCAHSETADQATRPEATATPQVKIHQGKLANGLKVLVLEDHSAPVVTVQVWYRTGSRNERKGIRGLAHLAEHMMFKGSENVGPEEHARIIDAVGGRENAFTSEDATAYYDTIPVDRLGLAMELEAERMARAKMEDSHFFKEREVVKEEIRLSLQNDPIGALLEKFRSIAFTVHPYNWTVGGTLEDLDKINLQDLRSFCQTYYAPNNAVLIVVGDTTHARVMELAENHFGSISAQEPPPKVSAVEPEQKEFRREELRHPTQLPMVIGGYKVPEAAHQDAAVLEVIHQILGGGKSSRIHRELVREKKLAAFAGAFNWEMLDPGLFLVFAAFLPMVPANAVEEALIGEVERLGREGPKPDELTKVRNQLTASYIFKLTSMQRLGFEIGQAEVIKKDYRHFLEGASPFQKVTAEDVKRVVSDYLKHDRLTVAVLLPPAAGQEVVKKAATKVEKAERETAFWPTNQRFLKLPNASSEPVVLPPIARKTLSNGLKLLVIERHEQPVVYFDLTVPGGNLIDPKGKAGMADLLAEMLTQGTKNRSAEQIAAEVEGLGGQLNASATTEYLSLVGRFLKRDFDQGLVLFSDVALQPTFPTEELSKVRPQVESSVRMTKDRPISLSQEHLQYLIYGYEHPRGRPASLETVHAVSAEDLNAGYRTAFQPQVGLLTVVGDVDSQQVLAALERAFGVWLKTGDAVGEPGEPPALKGRRVRLVDKPDLTQSTIAVGHLGISRQDVDYFRLLLGNYVLGGGGFSSRLMKNIRSKGGKTYGVGSFFSSGRTKGPFVAYTFTRNLETSNTLRMLLEEIERIRKGGVTEEELQSAKNNLAGSYALRLQPPDSMADEISSAEFYGLGEEWVRMYRKQVTAPTLEEVNAALTKHLVPKNLAVVVVGKATEIKGQVDKFGKPVMLNYLASVPDEERERQAPKKDDAPTGERLPKSKK